MSLPTPFQAAFHPGLTHPDGEICPTCEQLIPNDRLEQVKARHVEHQRELERQHALKLKATCEQLTVRFRQQNEESLTKLRQEAEAKEAAALAEERQRVTVEWEAKISAATTAMETMRSQADDLR